MQLVAVAICMIFFIVGCRVGKKNTENKFLLVGKKESISSLGDGSRSTILHFYKDVYKKEELDTLDFQGQDDEEVRFVVPLVGNSLYVNRTVTKKVYPDGFVEYGYNGYKMPLKDNEIKTAFDNVEIYCRTHCAKL